MRSENTEDLLVGMDMLHQSMESSYVRSADGTFYLEVRAPSGEMEYVQAEKGLTFQEGPNGKYTAIRDMEEYERRQSPRSHEEFFKDTKAAKNSMHRQKLIEKQLLQMASERVAPPPIGPQLERIKDEHYENLMAEYRKAMAKGEHTKCDFQPLSAYAHKLITKSGKTIRPLYKGEVGMKGNVVVVLEDGFGSGGFSAIPILIGGK